MHAHPSTLVCCPPLPQGTVLDLSSLVFPIACVVPPGEGTAAVNEAVLFRDDQRATGLPVGYAAPSVASLSLATVGVADPGSGVGLDPAGGCSDPGVGFSSPVPLTSASPALVIPTSGARIRLTG